jgi:hypothetical protein
LEAAKTYPDRIDLSTRDTECAVTLLTRHFENTTRTVLARLPAISPVPARR